MADRPYNVLVVDEHEETRRLLETLLSSDEGFRPLVADDRSQAVERMRHHPVDVFLVDLAMPQRRGFELLRDIRANPQYRNAPITVLATQEDPDERIQAFELGATDFLAKPFHVRELMARLRNQVRLKQLQDRLADEYQRDPLTALPNRRRLDEALDRAFRLARRGEPCAFAMLDVDEFKSVNDRYGHPTGDAVLRELADALTETVRDTDLVARFGGDEFALILDSATDEYAEAISGRLLDRIRSRRFVAGEREFAPSVSIGIAFIPDPRIGSVGAWIAAADAALYEAKREGRDRAVVWGRADPTRSAPGGVEVEALAAARQCVAELGDELQGTFVDRMLTLIAKVEVRQGRSHDHAERVRDRAVALARALGLADRDIRVIGRAALLRDIGKLAISPKILGRRGPLEDAELRIVREHPALSVAMLRGERMLSDLLPIIRHHHEHWDGSGYPDGLKGDQIPLGARIVGLVDAVLALESPRADRPAASAEEVGAWLAREAGRRFDPALVARFLELRGVSTFSEPTQAV